MIRSLRFRLFLGTTLVSALVLGCLSLAIEHSVRETLVTEFDRVLFEKARSLASMVDQHKDELKFDYQPSQFPEFEAGPHPAYFEILLDGNPFQQSPSLESNQLDLSGHVLAVENIIAAQPTRLPDDRHGRLLQISFQPIPSTESVNAEESEKALEHARKNGSGAIPPPTPQVHQGIVAIAQDTSDLDRTLDHIRLVTWGLAAAASLLTGAALLLVVGRAVKPVRSLAVRIGSLGETDLSANLDANAFPTELAPVVDRLNGLFQRLSDAFTRERAFTANVAHELRTPLAGLLTTLEVCRSRPRDAATYQASIDKCLSMLTRMQSLVENLLLLARADSGQLKLTGQPVDLAAVISESWVNLQDFAARRGLNLQLHADDSPTALADPEFLRIIFSNLFDNALSYAQPNTSIEVHTSATPIPNPALSSAPTTPLESRATINIINTGHSLTPADLPRLTDRFWRKDSARSNTGLHAGLGLSLVQRLVSLQQGTMQIRLDQNRFIITLTLPATQSPALVTS